MALLDQPEAQELLDDANVSPQAVRGCADRLTRYLARFLPLFGRKELREHARLAVAGRLSGLPRKASEPIAREADKPRRGLQRFVGAGEWDDETVMAELRVQVREELADPNAVLVLDPSSFPKKETESCGVQRQWCGRLGKIDNCQVGVFLAYAAAKGHAPLDRRLYLPESWAVDKKCHVPTQVKYQPQWQIGRELIEQSRDVPHAWVVGDDEFGRVTEFREALRDAGEPYVLDVPCNTLVRDLDERVRRRRGKRPRKPPFRRVSAWLARQPDNRWQAIEIVRAHSERHRIEETLQEGKGEVGLGHYEVRSWTGWHHHMTLCLLALLFVVLEKLRLGEKNTGRHGVAGASDLHGAVA